MSGQDGDKAALNRVALGTQTVSVWKDARDLGKAAVKPPSLLLMAPTWTSSTASCMFNERQEAC